MSQSPDPKSLAFSSGLWALPALKLVKAWKDCAGPALLRQTRFLGVEPEGGELVLKLEVPDPMWRQELEYQKDSILASYRKALQASGYPVGKMPTRVSLAASRQPRGSVSPGRPLPFKSRNPKK